MLKPSTASPPNLHSLTVRDLLNPDLCSWNNNVVNNLFSVTNALAIKDLPLHARNFHDTRVWNHSVNGNYTVKSAYRLCMSLQEEFSSSSVTTSRNWNALWKQQVPPRTRSMLWRMAHNCLPTRSRLLEKGLPINYNCVHCEQLAETHIHTFFCAPINVIYCVLLTTLLVFSLISLTRSRFSNKSWHP